MSSRGNERFVRVVRHDLEGDVEGVCAERCHRKVDQLAKDGEGTVERIYALRSSAVAGAVLARDAPLDTSLDSDEQWNQIEQRDAACVTLADLARGSYDPRVEIMCKGPLPLIKKCTAVAYVPDPVSPLVTPAHQ